MSSTILAIYLKHVTYFVYLGKALQQVFNKLPTNRGHVKGSPFNNELAWISKTKSQAMHNCQYKQNQQDKPFYLEWHCLVHHSSQGRGSTELFSCLYTSHSIAVKYGMSSKYYLVNKVFYRQYLINQK